jgi:hypothetical protein
MMKHVLVIVALVCIPCLGGTADAAGHSLSSAYHLSSDASFLGATLAKDFVRLNDRKLSIRGTVSYLAGASDSHGSARHPADRIEFGLATKNTMIAGMPAFSVIDLGYCMTRYEQLDKICRDSGFMFAFGLGARISESASCIGKYVSGNDSGARIAMEIEF